MDVSGNIYDNMIGRQIRAEYEAKSVWHLSASEVRMIERSSQVHIALITIVMPLFFVVIFYSRSGVDAFLPLFYVWPAYLISGLSGAIRSRYISVLISFLIGVAFTFAALFASLL